MLYKTHNFIWPRKSALTTHEYGELFLIPIYVLLYITLSVVLMGNFIFITIFNLILLKNMFKTLFGTSFRSEDILSGILSVIANF